MLLELGKVAREKKSIIFLYTSNKQKMILLKTPLAIV